MKDLEELFAAARDRPPADQETLERAALRLKNTLRARRERQRRIVTSLAIATSCLGGGALAAVLVEEFRPRAPAALETHEPPPPPAKHKNTVKFRREEAPQQPSPQPLRAFVRLEQPHVERLATDTATQAETVAPPIARPAKIAIDPPSPPQGQRSIEYMPRAIRDSVE